MLHNGGERLRLYIVRNTIYGLLFHKRSFLLFKMEITDNPQHFIKKKLDITN